MLRSVQVRDRSLIKALVLLALRLVLFLPPRPLPHPWPAGHLEAFGAVGKEAFSLCIAGGQGSIPA